METEIKRMKSKEMVDDIFSKFGFMYFSSKSNLKKFLDDFGGYLSNNLSENKTEVKIPNFGSFKLSFSEGKTINSPLVDGKEIQVKPRFKVKFKPSKKLKESLIQE